MIIQKCKMLGNCLRTIWVGPHHRHRFSNAARGTPGHYNLESSPETAYPTSLMMWEAYGACRVTLHPPKRLLHPPATNCSISVDIQEQVVFCSELWSAL